LEEASLPVILVGSRLVAGTEAESIPCAGGAKLEGIVQPKLPWLQQQLLSSRTSLLWKLCLVEPVFFQVWVVDFGFLKVFSPWERQWVLVAMGPGFPRHLCHCSGASVTPFTLCLGVPRCGASTMQSWCLQDSQPTALCWYQNTAEIV